MAHKLVGHEDAKQFEQGWRRCTVCRLEFPPIMNPAGVPCVDETAAASPTVLPGGVLERCENCGGAVPLPKKGLGEGNVRRFCKPACRAMAKLKQQRATHEQTRADLDHVTALFAHGAALAAGIRARLDGLLGRPESDA